MTLRPEYSLGHSAYNDFLFGSLGPGEGGTEITVLSALSRLGIDPWQEAERLAALPREAAAQALADTIARLPAGAFAASPEAGGAIASRLVALLPAGVVAAVLMSMGMMMVPPAIVSLPFKLAFFVVADGWSLIAGSLVQSYF